MGLETATYIDQLDPLNPLFNDFLKEADDHMRLIKSVLQSSFPNVNSAIPISELGGVVTLASSLALTGYLSGYAGTPTDNQVLAWVTANGRAEFVDQPWGSGTANQVAYWDGTKTITSNAAFTYDGTTVFIDGVLSLKTLSDPVLKIQDTSLDTNAQNYWIHTGSVSGSDGKISIGYASNSGVLIANFVDFENRIGFGTSRTNFLTASLTHAGSNIVTEIAGNGFTINVNAFTFASNCVATFQGKANFAAGTTAIASLNIPTGVAKTTQIQGDMHVTATDAFIYIDGVKESILASNGAGGGVAATPTPASGEVAYWDSTGATIAGDPNFSWGVASGILNITDATNVTFQLESGNTSSQQVIQFLDTGGVNATVGASTSGGFLDMVHRAPNNTTVAAVVRVQQQDGGSIGFITFDTGGSNGVTAQENLTLAGLASSGCTATFFGTAILPAATTSLAPMRIPHGTAPSSPTNGDAWTTTAGLFVRINGSTIGPLT